MKEKYNVWSNTIIAFDFSQMRSLKQYHLFLDPFGATDDIKGAFADCIDQDQTAQNVQSDLESMMSVCSVKSMR